MRVVLVDLLCNSPFYCAALTRALSEIGVDAKLASPRFYLEPEFLDDCPRPSWIRDLVVHASSPRPLRLAARTIEGSLNFLQLLARILAGRYDVVHVQWVPIEGGAAPFMRILRSACDRTGTLLVFTAHNAVPHDRDRVDLGALRRNLDRAHHIVAHTDHVARELIEDIGTVTPVSVIPHGPLFLDRLLPPRHEAATRLGEPSGPIVLFQGLIRPYKGLDLLLEAWPSVLEQAPSATLFVVGKIVDDPAAPELRRRAQAQRIEVVDRYVSVNEMLDYYAVADVVVFPYRRISQSGALMTAAGLGRPTVVTPIEGFRQQVEELKSAVVAEAVTGGAIAEALSSSLSRREELAAAAEADRTAIAKSPLGWTAVATATARLYEMDAGARR
jgi:glycosyltransferase involved in cell wall biosynthesis